MLSISSVERRAATGPERRNRVSDSEETKKDFVSRLSFPATEPPDPRRVSEGSLKGSLKGFRRVFEGF